MFAKTRGEEEKNKIYKQPQKLNYFFIVFLGQILWNRWAEEWVVLYDDSTMAWFTVSNFLLSMVFICKFFKYIYNASTLNGFMQAFYLIFPN